MVCVRKLVGAQRAVCRTMRATLQVRAKTAEQPYASVVYAFRHSQPQASFEWLDQCEAILFAPSNPSPTKPLSSSANTS